MLLMISGHERFLLLKEVILFVSTGLTIFFTFSSGLVAIATGISLVGIADFIVTMFILKNTLNFSIQRYMTYAQKNTVLTLSCGLMTYLLDSLIDFTHTNVLISIPIIGLSNGLLWLGIAWLQANPIINEINKFVEYHDGRYAA